MSETSVRYQCAIVGGGLAGLSLAIQLADRGVRVIVFEKYQYPFHKVCGEYISMESWDFLRNLGLPLDTMSLPVISQLGISSGKGFMLHHRLRPGGFGISRYTLDHELSRLAVAKGVELIENCKVTSARRLQNGVYLIETPHGVFESNILCGSYGKYTPSGIPSADSLPRDAGNYIGVKYHIKTDQLPSDRIELHNFNGGYCGISKVDQHQYCLCYLTDSVNLRNNEKNIRKMEESVLFRNPFLRDYFESSSFVRTEPVVISNVGFRRKATGVEGMFMLGDAAGSITPLCGNGMSMAMHASKILAHELDQLISGRQSLENTHLKYRRAWESAFGMRITAGYYLQHLLGKETLTDMTLRFLNLTSSLTSFLVSLTHGDPF